MRLEIELARGRFKEAVAAGRSCVEYAQRSGSRFDAVVSRSWLGIAQAGAGDWASARETLEEAAALAHERRMGLDTVLHTRFGLVAALHELGEVDRARQVGDEAVAQARDALARPAELRLRLVRARASRSRPAVANAELDVARRLIEETGARAYAPAILEERAALVPKRQRWEAILREALQQYTELGATGHVERLTRELAR
jgi:tetratricopeptide (TPR) repeat protein